MQSDEEIRNDKAMFDAYVSLRKIAQKYQLEEKLAIPRVVFVGETSSGKSMLVQNFLRFPCAFSYGDVGTRCPVLYRLRYNPSLNNGEILVKHPTGIKRAEDLAEHLRHVMERIGIEEGFRLEEYLVHIESNQYRDFEILDVPGLICGSHISQHLTAVEKITEHYVRDPTFIIVQLKESTQIGVNSSGTKRIRDFCLLDPAPCGSPLPPRTDYKDCTITIQTKFDLFMDGHRDGSHANEDMSKLVEHFNQRTLFVSMIFDVYNFGKHTYDENLRYIANLPELESDRVDGWISNMRKLALQSNNTYDEFDVDRFRTLIGINFVRSAIQDMWVKAFRGAVPKIQQILSELVQEQRQRYETILHMVEDKDIKSIRSTYQRYVECFRSTLTNYANYRAEIHTKFHLNEYGRTYKQIEEEYNQWSRKYSITWCAHQTADELMKKKSTSGLYSLPLRYVGARHFERIRQIFYHMILTYQPAGREQDWFESAQSILYGVASDGENVEKGVRESLYSYIREVFCLGICWLIQIYSFFLDHFEQQVTNVLLHPDGEFSHLAKGHTRFLSYVRLEYHKITRSFIRSAVEATKHARFAKMEYAAHSTCHFLRTLVESFPPTIKTNGQKEINITESNLHDLIIDSKSSLPENRNPETGNYLPETRNVIYELFTAVRGLLLHDITTNFFSHIVGKIGRYNSINIPDALQHRLHKISNKKIAQMSEVNLHENLKELQNVYEKLQLLEQACEEIERASQLFDGNIIPNYNEKQQQQEKKNILHDKRDRIHQEVMDKLYQIKTKTIGHHSDESISYDGFENDDDGDEEEKEKDNDENGLNELNGGSHVCQMYLLELFRRHDLEDLRFSFLEGDDFNVNKSTKFQQNQSLKTNNKTKSTKSLDKDFDDTKSEDDNQNLQHAESVVFDDNHLIDGDNNSNKGNDDKSKSKWHYKFIPKKTP